MLTVYKKKAYKQTIKKYSKSNYLLLNKLFLKLSHAVIKFYISSVSQSGVTKIKRTKNKK